MYDFHKGSPGQRLEVVGNLVEGAADPDESLEHFYNRTKEAHPMGRVWIRHSAASEHFIAGALGLLRANEVCQGTIVPLFAGFCFLIPGVRPRKEVETVQRSWKVLTTWDFCAEC